MVVKRLGVKGIIPLSMIDWDDRLVTTLFMGGCNMRCPFCHNSELVLDAEAMPDIDEAHIREVLVSKRGWVEGICITGGEPTISPRLFDLIDMITGLEYQIKLDTNGSRPDIIQRIIDERLVDAVSMDIKTSFQKYYQVTRTIDYSAEVKQSARILIDAHNNGLIKLEFRTTVVPTFVDHDDVIKIAKFLAEPGVHYVLQQFNPKNVMVPDVSGIRPFNKEELHKLAADASKFMPTKVRGFDQ